MRGCNLLAALLAATVVAGCSRVERSAAADTTHGDSAATSATSSAAGGASAAKTRYVGLQYDSLPHDITYRGGAVIAPGPATHNADYDVAHVTTPNGDMVWLDTLGAPVGRGLRAKIVRAELAVPQLANDERLFIASCDANGKLDPLVVALVVNEPGATRFTKIRQAWRVNIAAARFDLIPVAGIVCEDPGS